MKRPASLLTGAAALAMAPGATSMIGTLIILRKQRISPDAAFSGIDAIEGPIVGAILYFLMRETMADLGSV